MSRAEMVQQEKLGKLVRVARMHRMPIWPFAAGALCHAVKAAWAKGPFLWWRVGCGAASWRQRTLLLNAALQLSADAPVPVTLERMGETAPVYLEGIACQPLPAAIAAASKTMGVTAVEAERGARARLHNQRGGRADQGGDNPMKRPNSMRHLDDAIRRPAARPDFQRARNRDGERERGEHASTGQQGRQRAQDALRRGEHAVHHGPGHRHGDRSRSLRRPARLEAPLRLGGVLRPRGKTWLWDPEQYVMQQTSLTFGKPVHGAARGRPQRATPTRQTGPSWRTPASSSRRWDSPLAEPTPPTTASPRSSTLPPARATIRDLIDLQPNGCQKPRLTFTA